MKDPTPTKTGKKLSKKNKQSNEGTPQTLSNGPPASSTINAFQFMMNSRHRSIGGNSPGREIDSNDSETASVKSVLKERKSRFESWAEAKGAAKRKREYEEIGNCITSKLEKRGKRLKKLLNIDCQSDDEVVTKRRSKCVVIDSDSENEAPDCVQLTPNVKKWKFKIKLAIDKKASVENASVNNEPSAENASVTVENAPVNTQASADDASLAVENSPVIDNASVNPQSSDSGIDVVEVDIDPANSVSDENASRRVLRERKPKKYDVFFLLSDSDDEKKRKKKMKVAPVFLKAVPKPKLDPEAMEAKRQFLMSGIPSSLKKEIEKLQFTEEPDFDVFPIVSHVQQISKDNIFWDLPKVDLKLTSLDEKKQIMPSVIDNLLNISDGEKKIFQEQFVAPKKITNLKIVIKEIKLQNPNYPVYKTFNSLYEKSGYKIETVKEVTPKRRGRKKKNPLEKPPEIAVKTGENHQHTMWTEKYRARTSLDIIGNHKVVSSLKAWLSHWSLKENKRRNSESDFDITDSDSRDSTTSGNTVILKGPPGSGKTSSIYAVCSELGYNILEVNASSKRTGKRLIQELQEATQSHQVKKKQNTSKCVLLVEDVDVVFDQDEGFSAALSQIMSTSKRPIVLTTTDEPSSAIQRIINDCRVFHFSPLTSILTVWLQILCLIEGYFVKIESLGELLAYNRGDIRRTLLQLQLWVTSGGQPDGNHVGSTGGDTSVSIDIEDDPNLFGLDTEGASDAIQTHSNCVGQVLTNFKSFSWPHCNNFELMWWNFPRILNMPDFSNYRLNRENCDLTGGKTEKVKFQALVNCYDSLAFADVICGKNRFEESLERTWRSKEKDSLTLEENFSLFNNSTDLSNEIAQFLLSGQINYFKDNFDNSRVEFDVTLPGQDERRWRLKQIGSEQRLQKALLPAECLHRGDLALDYMPALRSIARSEFERAAHNTKRRNRFYSYLNNLGVHGSDSIYKSACDVFKI
ncbi:ATPase family AAA domain-containing protein 5 [Tribolium madens]|uniref:ATPase family AAA domain-containing protein 5 n=1 Tax=Tribolium madens TaxID=41895 RepID=UPI001CF74D83|nr:ATPase family AAA domain-containing protein 5 [Tribolium madens]